MDDKEYYSLTNRSSSWAVKQALRKNKSSENKASGADYESYRTLEARQGSADAQMLMEKNHSVKE